MEIVWRGTRAELVQRLYSLAPMLSGRVVDPTGAIHDLLMTMGLALLGQVQDDYVKKSEGGMGADGVTWAPLATSTLALRRKVAGKKSVEKLNRQFANLPQSRRNLIMVHYGRLQSLYSGPESSAARHHARRLLELMKSYIAPTRYKQLKSELAGPLPKNRAERLALAGAFATILRDTGRMFNSLSPKLESSDRVMQAMPGSIRIGSNVTYFKYHQSDRPRRLKADGTPRLPRRQILPDESQPLPVEYQRAVRDALADRLHSPEFWRRFLGSQASVA